MKTSSFPLASRERHPDDTVIHVGPAAFGGDHVSIIAGPCAIEGRDRAFEDARRLRAMGVKVMRGGAFKPRTSPYSFQGLGVEGLEILAEVRERYGLAVATEVLAVEDVDVVAAHADILQVGTRNMQNFRLLEALGRCGRPVLLKRGMAATVEETLCAAEYILAAGNPDVIICERGVRGFEPGLRGTLDLGAIALLREATHLPVIVDPSHATGRRSLVAAASAGSVAAGAHGVIVEATADPTSAIVDGDQTVDLTELALLVDQLGAIAAATGRELDLGPRSLPTPAGARRTAATSAAAASATGTSVA